MPIPYEDLCLRLPTRAVDRGLGKDIGAGLWNASPLMLDVLYHPS